MGEEEHEHQDESEYKCDSYLDQPNQLERSGISGIAPAIRSIMTNLKTVSTRIADHPNLPAQLGA